jgi:hypothetical protein
MRRKLLAIGATMAILTVMVRANAAGAQEPQTGTEKIAECLDLAWGHYENCMTDSPWWMTWPCGWKLEADAILCVPTMILPKK